MGGGGGKSVDTSAQEAELARQRAEAERLEAEAATKEKTRLEREEKQRMGRAGTLLTEGDGDTSAVKTLKTTLGG
jgi:hypothetical protein